MDDVTLATHLLKGRVCVCVCVCVCVWWYSLPGDIEEDECVRLVDEKE